MKNIMLKFFSACLVAAITFAVIAFPVGALTFDKVEADVYATYRSGANSVSSSYAGSQYYKNFKNVPLTGDTRTDTIAIALSQVGYQESTSGDYDGIGDGSSNYTEYNYNMGDFSAGYSYAWCATFVSWALLQGRATDQNSTSDWCRNHFYDYDYIWREVGCGNWANQLNYGGYFKYSEYQGGSYIPKSGDLIFFSWSSIALAEDHIGIVVDCDGSTVWTIEGNTGSAEGLEDEGGGVYFKSYALDYKYITGYGVLPYAEDENVVPIDYSGANPTTGIYMATSGDKSVYAGINDSSADCILPKFSMFEVLKIDHDDNGNLMLYSKCEIDGKEVYGWILHGSATNGYTRTVQIYTNPVPDLVTDVYEISEENVINGVSAGATVSDFIANVTSEKEIEIYKGDKLLSETDKIGTGMTAKIVSGETVLASYTFVVKGDINGDAKISGIDYVMIKRHVTNSSRLSGVYFDAGSIVRENKVTAYDYIMIKRYVMGSVLF